MSFAESVLHDASVQRGVSRRLGYDLGDFEGLDVARLAREGKKALEDAGYSDVRTVGIYERVDGREYLSGFGFTFRERFEFIDCEENDA